MTFGFRDWLFLFFCFLQHGLLLFLTSRGRCLSLGPFGNPHILGGVFNERMRERTSKITSFGFGDNDTKIWVGGGLYDTVYTGATDVNLTCELHLISSHFRLWCLFSLTGSVQMDGAVFGRMVEGRHLRGGCHKN